MVRAKVSSEGQRLMSYVTYVPGSESDSDSSTPRDLGNRKQDSRFRNRKRPDVMLEAIQYRTWLHKAEVKFVVLPIDRRGFANLPMNACLLLGSSIVIWRFSG